MIWTFVSRVVPLLFRVSRFIITFLPTCKCRLISWLQSTSTVILENKKINSVSASNFCPTICHEVMGPDAMIFVFQMLSFKLAFSLSSFTLIKRHFTSSSLSAIKVVSPAYLSVSQFSHSVVSNSLWPHESQHTRPPCPSLTPGIHSDSRPSSWWCHPAISSSVVPFSSCPRSLLASESFSMSQLFAWGGQSKVLEFQL